MIYLDNTRDLQEVWVPRNDGIRATRDDCFSSGYDSGYTDGFNEGRMSGVSLQEKEAVIDSEITEIRPDEGYDGMSLVTVDAGKYGEMKRGEGYREGQDAVMDKIVTTAVTMATMEAIFVPPDGLVGFSSVKVDAFEYGLDQYHVGREDGIESGYESGFTEGQDDIKSNITSTAFTENGEYTATREPFARFYGGRTVVSNYDNAVYALEMTVILYEGAAGIIFDDNYDNRGNWENIYQGIRAVSGTGHNLELRDRGCAASATLSYGTPHVIRMSGTDMSVDGVPLEVSGTVSGEPAARINVIGIGLDNAAVGNFRIWTADFSGWESGPYWEYLVRKDEYGENFRWIWEEKTQERPNDAFQTQGGNENSPKYMEYGAYGWSAVTVNVPTGDTIINQSKTVEVTGATQTVTYDSGYTGLESVLIDAGNYGSARYQEGYGSGHTDGYQSGYEEGDSEGYNDGYAAGGEDTLEEVASGAVAVSYDSNGTYFASVGDNGDGYITAVTVTVAQTGTTINNQTKSVTLTANGVTNITYDEGYTGLESVELTVNVPDDTCLLQEKEYLPVSDTFEILPDEGYDGMSKVSVDATDYVNAEREAAGDLKLAEVQQGAVEMSVTANGRYEADIPLNGTQGYVTAVTVNVPQSGGTGRVDVRACLNSGLTFCGMTWTGIPEGFDFNTSTPLTDGSFGYLFYNCSSLVSVPVISANGATNITAMFFGCSSLPDVTMDVAGVEVTTQMFATCYKLTGVSLTNMDSIVTAVSMFAASGLKDVSDMVLMGAENVEYFFTGCKSLTSVVIDIGDALNSARFMFSACTALEHAELYIDSDVYSTYKMFGGCTSLEFVHFKKLPDSDMSEINLDNCPLTHDSLVGLLNALPQSTGGYSFQIGQTNINKLTEEEIAIATDKGWTLVYFLWP